MHEREFDVILYGATGFTGRKTVAYFQQYAPQELRWAVAGRNRAKLEALGAGVPVLAAASTDEAQADALTTWTRVMLSTAGPYELYGDQLVASCVKARTHYVDITGETVWARSLIDRFQEQAERDGTRIVPFCGFDSVPADLGVWLLAQRLGPGLRVAKGYFQAKGGRPNGGTIASAHRTYSSGADKIGADLFLLSPGMNRAALPLEADPTRASYDADVRAWVAPFPMSIIDTRVVRRSCQLMGMEVSYQEFFIFEGTMGRVWAEAATLGTGLFYKALQTPFFRNLAKRTMAAGDGPSEKTMDGGSFSCRM